MNRTQIKPEEQIIEDLLLYVQRLFELSKDFTKTGPMSWSDWRYEASDNPAERLARDLEKQLAKLPRQTARSQVLMLNGSATVRMHVYYAHMFVQFLVQRETLRRQLNDLQAIMTDCKALLTAAKKIRKKDQVDSERISKILDLEYLKTISSKYEGRLSDIRKMEECFRLNSCLEARISNMLTDLYQCNFDRQGFQPMETFGIVDLPYDLKGEGKYSEQLAQALRLYTEYEGYKISPYAERKYGKKPFGLWDLEVADECREEQGLIDKAAGIIEENRDTADMRWSLETIVKMV